MKKLLSVAAFLLTFFACGGSVWSAPEYSTIHGFRVLRDGVRVTPYAIESVISIQLQEMSSYYGIDLTPYYLEFGPRLIIVLTKDPVEIYGERVGGYFDGDLIVVSMANRTCVGASSLGHELVHFAQWLVEGRLDARHVTAALWSEPDAVEIITDARTLKEVCEP